MKPKSFGAEANSSGDDSDELDKLLRDSVKKKHGGQVKKPQASQDGFSDTEMEDVMAAVPLSILKSQQVVPGITEKRKRESDEGPPRKRRRPGHSLEPQPNFRSEEAITEIDLSLCSLSPALTYSELIHPSSRLDAHTGKDKVTHVGRPNQGLFLPASSDDVQWHVDKKETESNQKTTTLPWSDDDPWKFELDPNIFERGTGILAPLGVEKNRGIKDVEQQPLIDKGQNMSNQQEVRSSQENLLKELDDDALFEMLIKGISTV
ncbi:hypothetical protein FRC18_005931 [Serendipita sp. 400]|nr:hypothetical protein FRC18_005931 [Serendipita sp. 400]